MEQQMQRAISRYHPAMAGHFPGNPVVPGVVLLTELLGAIEREIRWKRGPVTVTSMKFMRLLRPEEPFTLRLEILSDREIRFAVTRENDHVAVGTVRWTDSGTEQGGS